jgi:two-component system, NtrC family, sensor kinase
MPTYSIVSLTLWLILCLLAQPAIAQNSGNITNTFFLLSCLSGLCILQLLGIMYLLLRRQEVQTHTDDLDPILQKTKFQLQREIARHETTEELLLETRDYLDCLVNSLPTVIIGVTENGLITHWNIAAEEMTGVSVEQAIGRQITSVFNALQISSEQLRSAVTTKKPFILESIPYSRDAHNLFLDVTVQPLISTDTIGAVILVQDVTMNVRMERSFIQNEKMLSLGVMAAGLAHEINNPLAAIISNVQTINRRILPGIPANTQIADELNLPLAQIVLYFEKREIPKFLDGIQQASERAAKIVKTMLEFSHAQNSTFSLHDIVSLVDESLELATKSFELKANSTIKMPFIIRDYDPQLQPVECAASEIQQVLLNLLLNAAQAIQSSNPPTPNPTINLRIQMEKKHVLIVIHDNGPGMTENVQKHIFEPFFTTKDVGVGTGLGLSVSYFIIKEHHQGSIEVESKPGKGTRFSIRLPLVQNHPNLPPTNTTAKFKANTD